MFTFFTYCFSCILFFFLFVLAGAVSKRPPGVWFRHAGLCGEDVLCSPWHQRRHNNGVCVLQGCLRPPSPKRAMPAMTTGPHERLHCTLLHGQC